ncbi:Glycosyl transferase family 90 [Sulfitobacter marinus]|uniref:Glycosyl transferase family 90 n=1 Tax=Sulfitobacter marinus TaxID=394264 RepID=A0A1I6VTT3_9RHOB|nr:glycosyl transferase family 90 [Sulfitobacter marinus]SFT16834.1 Glycosyl transferase family 90 [Sulfitobacter marinus]
MITSKDFVERSIAHQLGPDVGYDFSLDPAVFEFVANASSGMALWWDHGKKMPRDLNDWKPSNDSGTPWDVRHNRHSKTNKTSGALKDILGAGADFDFLLDMQDHRSRSVITDQGHAAPLFNFNRLHERPAGHVLWPLPHYHDIDSPEFLGNLDPLRVDWAEKSDRVVWRGGPGNRGRLGQNARGTMIRMHPLLRKYKSGEFTRDETLHVLKSMQRFRFLYRYIDNPRFDLGYTNSDGFVLQQEPFLADFERPRIPREDFQNYKYIVVLPGNDVGSSLYWSLNSGSVALVVDCAFETFATHHFRPWEHYVPIRKNHGNVEKQLGWCETHQEECREMTLRAAEVCKLLADADLRAQIAVGVVDGVRRRLGLKKVATTENSATKPKAKQGAHQTILKKATARLREISATPKQQPATAKVAHG